MAICFLLGEFITYFSCFTHLAAIRKGISFFVVFVSASLVSLVVDYYSLGIMNWVIELIKYTKSTCIEYFCNSHSIIISIIYLYVSRWNLTRICCNTKPFHRLVPWYLIHSSLEGLFIKKKNNNHYSGLGFFGHKWRRTKFSYQTFEVLVMNGLQMWIK